MTSPPIITHHPTHTPHHHSLSYHTHSSLTYPTTASPIQHQWVRNSVHIWRMTRTCKGPTTYHHHHHHSLSSSPNPIITLTTHHPTQSLTLIITQPDNTLIITLYPTTASDTHMYTYSCIHSSHLWPSFISEASSSIWWFIAWSTCENLHMVVNLQCT